jgi:hypothetical protein
MFAWRRRSLPGSYGASAETIGRRFFDRATQSGLREFVMFALKEAWACLFGGAMGGAPYPDQVHRPRG